MKKRYVDLGWYLKKDSEKVEVSTEDFLKHLKRIKEEGIEEKYVIFDSYNSIKEEN